jgi:hypothetical protein
MSLIVTHRINDTVADVSTSIRTLSIMEQHAFELSFTIEGTTEKVHKFYALLSQN